MTLDEIGRAVAEARKRRKLTQAELAKSAGVSRRLVNQLESGGLKELGFNKLLAICRLLSLELCVKEPGESARPDAWL